MGGRVPASCGMTSGSKISFDALRRCHYTTQDLRVLSTADDKVALGTVAKWKAFRPMDLPSLSCFLVLYDRVGSDYVGAEHLASDTRRPGVRIKAAEIRRRDALRALTRRRKPTIPVVRPSRWA